MLKIDFRLVADFFQTNWSWAVGLAAAMLTLTGVAGALLNPQRKDEIALWLMGAQSEKNWSRTFASLFDAVFGERHLSFRCLWRSAVVSLIAVASIWLFLGNVGALELRARSNMTLGGVLLIGLGVNVVADYVSLLETRWLLGQMHRVRSTIAQFAVLVLDCAASAAIIWMAILAFRASPLYGGESEGFAEILGVFSIFSVFFYSTFVTSVWTWAYILSTWVLRLFTRLRLVYLLDVEHKPILILGNVLAVVVFLGSLGVAVPMQKDANGLSPVDRGLCSLFKGRVCLDVARLTTAEQAQLDLILLACEGGLPEECARRADEAAAAGEKMGSLLYAACEGGHKKSCFYLGVLAKMNAGKDPDLQDLAIYLYAKGAGFDMEEAHLYPEACEGGHGVACTRLAILHEVGGDALLQEIGADALLGQFERNQGPTVTIYLYRRGCHAGDAEGCYEAASLLYIHPLYLVFEGEIAKYYRKACDGGYADGCWELAGLHKEGKGVDQDPAMVAKYLRKACKAGKEQACDKLTK